MELRKGQKIPLNENLLTITLERKAASALDIDTAAFLLGENGKAQSDEDFVFYGNTRHNSGSVVYKDEIIGVDLSKIPARIEKISFTATIYEADKRRQNFSMVKGSVLRVNSANGAEIANFRLDDFTIETAIVLGEIYRYKGAWKFNATGAGFKGGLPALCNNFGIEVIEDTAPPTPAPPPKITPPKTPPPDVPKKIELRKGRKVNLVKKGNTLGEIVINLNWKQPAKKSGFFGGFSGGNIDLDLCCLYEMKDGMIGGVQALGNNFGSFRQFPYIELDGDDRTGGFSDGETIRVNGKFLDKIQRILIFTFIYEGAADWEEAQGVVTVKCPGSPDLIVKMDEYGSRKRTCAIALLENVGETFSVEKIVEFYDDASKMDADFDWGLNWTTGRKN